MPLPPLPPPAEFTVLILFACFVILFHCCISTDTLVGIDTCSFHSPGKANLFTCPFLLLFESQFGLFKISPFVYKRGQSIFSLIHTERLLSDTSRILFVDFNFFALVHNNTPQAPPPRGVSVPPYHTRLVLFSSLSGSTSHSSSSLSLSLYCPRSSSALSPSIDR